MASRKLKTDYSVVAKQRLVVVFEVLSRKEYECGFGAGGWDSNIPTPYSGHKGRGVMTQLMKILHQVVSDQTFRTVFRLRERIFS